LIKVNARVGGRGDDSSCMTSHFPQLYEAILSGDTPAARALTEQALGEGVDALELVQRAMGPAMEEAGRRFECNDYFVPELLLASRAMKACMEPIRPLLASRGSEPIARVVIGAVRGDLHDIGKNLVAALLEGGGFEVTDLGVNVPPEKFVSTAKETHSQLVAMSALLTTTMSSMRSTIEALQQAGMRSQIKIMVGGAPVNADFARKIGADGYGTNAVEALALARKLLGPTRKVAGDERGEA
jgi:5-methyltetrahydrofolate--homocysteine methyltransferase